MKFIIEIPNKRITDLLHGHGGSYSPWMHEMDGKWDSRSGCKVKFDREKDEEGEGKGRKIIRARDVARGFAVFSRLPSFSDFMAENDDDLTFDCGWQCIIFGKLVYG